jgi:uncharacterized protein
MTSQPLSQSTRIESIDVLRGFTLFGIMLVHMVEQYYAGPIPDEIAGPIRDQTKLADNIVSSLVDIFIRGKFYMIFSFLFGLSFFFQSSKRDSSFLLRFAWRLIVLFGIGLVHHLHYRGDILTIYAMLGFGLLLFSWLPDRILFIVAIILVLNIPAHAIRILDELGTTLPPPGSGGPGADIFNQDQNELMKYYKAVKFGSYGKILLTNLAEFSTKMKFQIEFGRLYITLGLFLLGVYAGRKKWFENLSEKRLAYKRTVRYSLWSVLGVILTAVTIFGGANVLGIPVAQPVQFIMGMIIFDLFNLPMAIFYVAGIVVLFLNAKWSRRLMVFYPVGRMGLTIYLVQSLMGTLIFFSYGLGLLFEFGAATCLALGVVLFVMQVFFARIWFNYFQYGPIEWFWRSLTYFKFQPMKKKASSKSIAID